MHKPHGKKRRGRQDGGSATTGVAAVDRPPIPRAPVGAQIVYVAKPQRTAGPAPDRTWWSLGASLAAVAVASKFALLPFPVSNVSEFARWVLRLLIVASPDICFAAALTASCYLVWRTLSRWPRAASWAWTPACFGVYATSAAYAVASIPMFKVTMVPFTVRLLSFVGGPEVMISSVAPHLPSGIVAALILAPLAVLLSPWITRRLPLLWQWPAGVKTALAALALIAAYGLVCRGYIHASWTDPNRWERRIAQSPHWVFLSSCLEEVFKDRPFTQNYAFESIDDSDFRTPPRAAAEARTAGPLLPAAERPKNVLMIVMESTGVEYFGAHGSKYPTTPRIDALAADHGIVFDNVYSQAASSCKSLVALSNSVYSRPDWLLIVRDYPNFDVKALPQVFKDQGYRTCYAHSGYWEWQGRHEYLKARGVDKLISASGEPEELINSWGVHDDVMYQHVLDWIDERPDEPFFAFAYTIETHHPYVAPKERYDFGVDDEELDRYLNAVRAADAKIAHLIDELERRGLADSTVIAVTADHGESFGQHNQRTHSFGVYEQAVHVPLVLIHPSLRDMPRHRPTLGRHMDIGPTLLDLLNVPAPKEWQGVSLLRPGTPERAYFLSVGNEVTLGLRDGKYKYHYYIDTLREELFDVEADPGELHDLAGSERDRCEGYRRKLGGWVSYQRAFLAAHGAN
ncbi:MAG TPA: sulfatase-like hydrolase/transferase [Pirellulales bacterium]|nr:sulfatase-like hydrolase/transferase [Pirellulales bacterium]